MLDVPVKPVTPLSILFLRFAVGKQPSVGSQAYNFQFSFWDSLSRAPGPSWPCCSALSILFLRFEISWKESAISSIIAFQFSFWDSSTWFGNSRMETWLALSILFLRFLTSQALYKILPYYSSFQFSFWDSYKYYSISSHFSNTAFNSLFEILDVLSDMVILTPFISFQFSFWDSKLHFFVGVIINFKLSILFLRFWCVLGC